MNNFPEILKPNRNTFSADPFGYSVLSFYRMDFMKALLKVNPDQMRKPDSKDLKSPLLWLCHAHALAEAARCLLSYEPEWDFMPKPVQGICDSQYCSVALMLTGLSLEVSLKGMLILKHGIDGYEKIEKNKYHHHNLEDLSEFIPSLVSREKAILKILSFFYLLVWQVSFS